MLSSDKKDFPNDGPEFTGERFLPQRGDPLLALEHYHRYFLASRFVENKRVLDIACGEGYGSAFLSMRASEVVGIDSNSATIEHARVTYSWVHNVRFDVGNCGDIAENPEKFDAIVSFETIEHLDENDQTKFLENVRRSLKPDGLFIVSSPERDEYAEAFPAKNQFHKHEMTLSELREFLGASFKHIHICAQRVLSLSAMWQLDGWRDASFQLHARRDLLAEIPSGESFSPPLYLIAICSNAPLKDYVVAESNSFYFDKSNIEQTKDLFQWTQRLSDEVQKGKDAFQNLQQQFEERTAWALDLEKQILDLGKQIKEKDDFIEKQKKEIEERTQWAFSLESEVARERAFSTQLNEKLAAITAALFYRIFAKLKLIPR
jgi:O-antigen biosynthesis protein